MKVLVIGGTGTVGSAVVTALRAIGHEPRVMTRSADGAARVPQPLDRVVADLDRPDTLRPAFSGVDAAFLMAPIGPTETARGLAAVEAARAARLRRLVYMSAFMPAGSESVPLFASKLPVERAVRESGLHWAVLKPNNFYQNDVAFREAIAGTGVYPVPLGPRGLNRVDVRDVAEAAARACELDVNGVVPLNGPRGMTGDDTARVYSEQLGRPVRYAGDDLDAWARNASARLPAPIVSDLRAMYDYMIRNGSHASGRDFAAQERLLGRAPRPFEEFAAELAAQWQRA